MAVQYTDFEGKVVAVVGGALGIGRACATMFSRQKAKVIVADVNEEAGTELQEAVSREGGWLRYVHADATRAEDLAKVREQVEREGQLVALVNCVGGWTVFRPALELGLEDWDAGIRLNLYSTFQSCQALGRLMKDGGGGAIVNVSSAAAKRASPRSPIFYGVAKAGVEALTRGLAAELGRHGIRVNAIAPGATTSERIKRIFTAEMLEGLRAKSVRGKVADPEEIASVVLFLASSAAVHVTGTVLLVTGGEVIVA